MKPPFYPKTAKKLTCYDKNKWKKNETGKNCENFHSKNETGETIKKSENWEIFQKHPLGQPL